MEQVKVPLAVVASVLAADLITKTLLDTPAWALHQQPREWQFSCLACLCFFALICFFRPLVLGAALLLAGTLANLLDSLNGPVRNPIVHDFGAGNVAFNVADLALYAGGVALWCAFALLVLRSLRAWRVA